MPGPSIRHTADGTRRFTSDELEAHLRNALHAFPAERIEFEAVSVGEQDVWLRATVHAVSLATMAPVSIAWLAQNPDQRRPHRRGLDLVRAWPEDIPFLEHIKILADNGYTVLAYDLRNHGGGPTPGSVADG